MRLTKYPPSLTSKHLIHANHHLVPPNYHLIFTYCRYLSLYCRLNRRHKPPQSLKAKTIKQEDLTAYRDTIDMSCESGKSLNNSSLKSNSSNTFKVKQNFLNSIILKRLNNKLTQVVNQDKENASELRHFCDVKQILKNLPDDSESLSRLHSLDDDKRLDSGLFRNECVDGCCHDNIPTASSSDRCRLATSHLDKKRQFNVNLYLKYQSPSELHGN